MLLPVPFFHVTGCHSVLVPTYAAGNKLVLSIDIRLQALVEEEPLLLDSVCNILVATRS